MLSFGKENQKGKKGNINSGLRKGRFINDRFKNAHYVAENKLERISVSENNRTINYIYLEKLKHVSRKLFFECNFSPDDVNSIVKIKQHIYKWHFNNVV